MLALLLLLSLAVDPATVQRHGKGYRYRQAGWIVVHIEGAPQERGVQHGRLLAPEIAAKLRCYAAYLSPKAPAEGWKLARTLSSALFLRGHDREYLEEMKGIAQGASDAGARLFDRRIDLLDIVTLNAWPEIGTLDRALRALPTGLEGKKARLARLPERPTHCSAFAATGPATRDGKIVFGHITMFRLYPANFYNVWLDIKPQKGHRVVMQSFPGGIHSGMDYYLNDAGLMIAETTISQTRFGRNGAPLASRIRRAMQYAETIDEAVAILKKENNGLYTNEWLLGDAKTNEIAMFELGTRKTRLWRSSKDEWFGQTRGFYWGCNNTKDLEVRLEALPGTGGRPGRSSFVPSARDKKWVELYQKHKGQIDEEFGKLAFTTPPLAAFRSVDAKFTTSTMAKGLRSWALFGPPLGRTWQPTFEERTRFPEIRPLVSNPWTILTGEEPRGGGLACVDLGVQKPQKPLLEEEDEPAWHGTLLPGDAWLALAWPAHERLVARQLAGLDVSAMRQGFRSRYAMATSHDMPLSTIKPGVQEDAWAGVAEGKGVLMLEALKEKMGLKKYVAAMEAFGKENAGKPASAAAFRKHMGYPAFFKVWLDSKGLPGGEKGCPFHVWSFLADLERTIIIYGTRDEQAATREAALALQDALRRLGPNITVEVAPDTKPIPKGRPVILVGRPAVNALSRQWRKSFAAEFGEASCVVNGKRYAHGETALLVAGQRDGQPLLMVAGLSARATRQAVESFAGRGLPTSEAVVLRPGRRPEEFVLPVK